jgi:hypothetical protein
MVMVYVYGLASLDSRLSTVKDRGVDFLNFFPPNRGVDFYFEYLPAKSRSRFLFVELRRVSDWHHVEVA